MNRITIALLLLAPLAACGSGGRQAPPLEGAAIGGPFALTDQNGRTVRDGDFAGRYRVMYFGYTYCPDVCPVDLQNIGQALRQLETSDPGVAARVVPLFVTVDPERDTPAVLKQYVGNFHPRLIGLTGSPQAIAKVAEEYKVYYKKQQTAPGADGYLVNHMRVAYLMSPAGKPLALLPADQSAAAVAAEIKRWVQ